MIRGCLFGLSLSVIVVSVAGYMNASRQAQQVRNLQRTVEGLRQFTAAEFADARQAASSANREFTRKLQAQREQLAQAERQVQESLDRLAVVQQELDSATGYYLVELDACRQGVRRVTERLDGKIRSLETAAGGLARRLDSFENEFNPLRDELAHVESRLSQRIDGERAAREKLAGRCQATLAAEGKLLDSYCFALKAMAESRKVRAAVEQELAAEAELEADLLSRLANEAHGDLVRLNEPPATKPAAATAAVTPRVAQAQPHSNSGDEAQEQTLPELIDAASGKVAGEKAE